MSGLGSPAWLVSDGAAETLTCEEVLHGDADVPPEAFDSISLELSNEGIRLEQILSLYEITKQPPSPPTPAPAPPDDKAKEPPPEEESSSDG